MRKRIISWMLAIVMLLSLMPTMSVETHAATISSYEPYPNIETAYTASVQCGTVRYISQTSSSTYFNDAFWGSWKSQAGIECGTACISMALSYIGVNKTPKDILDAGQGSTYFGWTWGDGVAQSYTANDYTLALTSLSSVYGPAYDAKGNSCIKLGTSKVVGSLSFTVPANVTSVVIYAAKYKANT